LLELSGESLLKFSDKFAALMAGPPENIETISSDFASKNTRVKNAFGLTL